VLRIERETWQMVCDKVAEARKEQPAQTPQTAEEPGQTLSVEG
jgi:hypothetical protein